MIARVNVQARTVVRLVAKRAGNGRHKLTRRHETLANRVDAIPIDTEIVDAVVGIVVENRKANHATNLHLPNVARRTIERLGRTWPIYGPDALAARPLIDWTRLRQERKRSRTLDYEMVGFVNCVGPVFAQKGRNRHIAASDSTAHLGDGPHPDNCKNEQSTDEKES